MPIRSRYGRTIEGDSPILALVGSLREAEAIKDQADAANSAAQKALLSATVGAIPVLGGLTKGLFNAGMTISENTSQPRQNATTPIATSGGLPGVGGGSGQAIADLARIAAQEKLQSRMREAESTQRTAALVGASGGALNSVLSAGLSAVPAAAGAGGATVPAAQAAAQQPAAGTSFQYSGAQQPGQGAALSNAIMTSPVFPASLPTGAEHARQSAGIGSTANPAFSVSQPSESEVLRTALQNTQSQNTNETSWIIDFLLRK
jgi:hypothetical protein